MFLKGLSGREEEISSRRHLGRHHIMASGSILTQNQYDGKKNLCSLIRDACSVYACLHVYITIYLCKF